MAAMNRQQTAPNKVPRTNRNNAVALITTLPAGKVVPIAAIGVLREDAAVGSISVKVEMQETREMLMNGVTLRLTAYCVPDLARPHFEGSRDQFDRSWAGEPKIEGGAVVPFVPTRLYGAEGSNPVLDHLGLHAKPTDMVSTQYDECYNIIDNYRARNRSRDLPQRQLTDKTLAPAFWNHSRFDSIVPDFDQASVDGLIALNVTEATMPITGLAWTTNGKPFSTPGSSLVSVSGGMPAPAGSYEAATLFVKGTTGTATGEVFAELQADGISISLARMEVAKKTRAFAELRKKFDGYDDEYIIDALMDGLTIPEQHLKQPILLADQTVTFSQAKRYATDAGNLAESAVSGAAIATLRIRLPRLSTGGMIMVLAEAVPQQMFERQRDPWLHLTDARDATGMLRDLPSYVRDYMDQEKVDIIFNKDIDTSHTVPNAHFGYGPLGWRWTNFGPRAGGDYKRPQVDAAVDDIRQGLWAQETVDPALSEAFYRVLELHLKPFLDDTQDPFRAAIGGNVVLNGNTVFGPLLVEASDNYAKVSEKHSPDLIEKP